MPFALAAGLSAAVPDTSLIVTAGLAEVAAGAIAMGLGGYLAARTDAQHYDAELARERLEVEQLPHKEVAEVEEVLREYGLEGDALRTVVTGPTRTTPRGRGGISSGSVLICPGRRNGTPNSTRPRPTGMSRRPGKAGRVLSFRTTISPVTP